MFEPELTVNEIVQQAFDTADDKGWHEDSRTFGDIIALAHSELSEALEDFRNGHEPDEIYFEGDKPCGIPTELADVIIRIADACGVYGIDLDEALKVKLSYNLTRDFKHGGKVV